MNIGIVIGSMQAESNSAKVGRYIDRQLQQRGLHGITLDLGKTPLPLWGSTDGDQSWDARYQTLSEQFAACEGFVLISPEYHGMVPAALKNALLHFGSAVLAHKPAYIVGVSAGTGGAYPVAELRMSSSKNNRLCFTPEHCIVRQADQVLNSEEPAQDAQDQHIRRRLDYGLAILVEYAHALKQVRDSGVIDHTQFANGM
ncbi:MAG: NAD(P)H-dependent oxidoreductase [Oceanococcaceae bacterium]